MRRIVRLILVICICAVFFGGCSSKKDVIGKWYNDRGKCLDVRSDGSWKLEDSYGTGTWKLLDDGIFEFTDFYGDTQESAINKDDLGEFIDFGWYGNFYRDGYPEKEETKKTEPKEPAATKAPETKPTTAPTTAPTEPTQKQQTVIDPFEGLSFEVTGVSPYCKVAVNNSKCSKDAQLFVTYELDKEHYENGASAVVTASLSNADDEMYVLSTTETTYTISGMPEYITSVEDVDLSFLEAELGDYVTAKTNEAIGSGWVFDATAVGLNDEYVAIDIEERARYFTSVKKIKEHRDIDYYNSLNMVYSISGDYKYNTEGADVYVLISAYNIIEYPDGTIKWGRKDPDSYAFEHFGSLDGVDYLVSTRISTMSADYNIAKVELENGRDESIGTN